MIDFTLKAYRRYLEALLGSYPKILRFADYLQLDPKPPAFCLLRHDVDRKPLNALKMARLEASLGAGATYFFRTKPHCFQPEIISQIAAMGHEIGYHYESLSDAGGSIERALDDFENNLARLRNIAPVSTVCMHGRPFNAYDNRDIWRTAANHQKLTRDFSLLGEVYLDVDYTEIAYITDTGRNWLSAASNRRDRVNSKVKVEFQNGKSLLAYLGNQPHPRLVFQIHPERWTDGVFEYLGQLALDRSINLIKSLI